MRKLYTILTIAFFYFAVFLQKGIASDIVSDYEGKHFYIGFMQNEIQDAFILTLQILIVSNYPAEIIVKIPGETDRLYNLASNSILKIDVKNSLEIVENEMIVQKSIEIISTVPILVYSFNSQLNSSSCFTAVPVTQWGHEYVVISYPNDQYTSSFEFWGRLDSSLMVPRKSEFLIIASEDDTRVEIIPKSVTQSLRQKDQPDYVTLNRGDCYLVQSYDFAIGMGDLTGSIIRSEKPIGVISGHMRVAVPQFMDRYFESKDHIAVMLTPTNSWGRQFYSVPYEMHAGGDLFRIVTQSGNTVVNVEMQDTAFSFVVDNPYSFKDIPAVKKPAKWTSNNPIQIGQYMMRIGGWDDHFDYDPSLVVLPPAEQFVQRMVFQTVGNEANNPEQYIGYAIYIIADEKSLNSLKLNNDLIKEFFPAIIGQKFPDGEHHWARLPISRGSYRLTCDEGKFSGVAYGYGRADSYTLTLGSSLTSPYTTDSLSPNLVVEESCGNISGTITEFIDKDASGLLFAVMTDESFNYTYELSPKILDSTYSTTFTARPYDVMKDGKFVLEYRDKNGNGQSYTFNYSGINFNVPGTISLGVVNKGDTNCMTYSIKVTGANPVHLDSVKIVPDNDRRFDATYYAPLPVVLEQNTQFDFKICFHPDSSFDDLNQRMMFYFDCERYDSLMIMAMVRYPELEFIGYDFGEVCLGDTASGEIKIINSGNVPAIIDSLYEITANSSFNIILKNTDDSDILPDILQPGNILTLSVQYIPDNIGYDERIVSAKNDLSFDNEIKMTGTGIAPLVSSITLDWGKRRIGTVNDTVIFLQNTGACNAEISYNGSDGNLIPFMIDSVINLKDSIFPIDSLGLFFSFNPPKLENYLLVSFFKVDSPGHDLVNVTKTGEGTLPAIQPVDIKFDTIPIFSYKDSLCLILRSRGNERLWINYKSTSGDDSCFIINNGDYSIIQNTYIEPGTDLIVPIRFNPKKLDLSSIELKLEHDAFPAYRTGDTVLKISGFSIEVDTVDPEIKFKDNLIYLPCQSDEMPVYLINNGNVDLSLDSLTLNTQNADARWIYNYQLPILIKPDSIVELKLKVFPKANETGKISVSAVYNDTIKYQSDEITIIMDVMPILIDDFGILDYNIGDKGSLLISGAFPYGSEIPVGFDLNIQVKHKYMHLLNPSAILEIITGVDTNKYDLPLSQTLDNVFGETKDEIIIKDTSKWQVNLDFLCLLADSRETNMLVQATSELCYSEGKKASVLNFLGVCEFDIRKLVFDETGLFDAEIRPNPVANELCIKINLRADDWINLSIFDQNGKKIIQNENYFLKKGTNSLIFELMPMANGVYVLSIRTKLMLKNIMFIINK